MGTHPARRPRLHRRPRLVRRRRQVRSGDAGRLHGCLRRPRVQHQERRRGAQCRQGVRRRGEVDLLLHRRSEGAQEGGGRPRLHRPPQLHALPPRVQRHHRAACGRHQRRRTLSARPIRPPARLVDICCAGILPRTQRSQERQRHVPLASALWTAMARQGQLRLRPAGALQEAASLQGGREVRTSRISGRVRRLVLASRRRLQGRHAHRRHGRASELSGWHGATRLPGQGGSRPRDRHGLPSSCRSSRSSSTDARRHGGLHRRSDGARGDRRGAGGRRRRQR